MKRVAALVFLLGVGGCYTQANDRAVPVAVVNSCGRQATQESCGAVAGCEWRAVKSECPIDADCPGGVCVTPDACGQLADKAACEADTNCAWAGVRLESASIDLCLVGQSCDTGGYCRARDATGGGCTCVQPIACPANADCPAVECDCSNTASGGGGTCTCTCPICVPGEACPSCACHCSGGGSACGGGTCTCACPACAPGASCPPCDCACGAGNVGVRNGSADVPSPMPGGSSTAGTAPCTDHGDAVTCAADSANSCRWVELGIVCVTMPCPSGACVQVKSVPGGGGCGCACPACAPGQSCPPCACDCCGSPSGVGAGPAPVPVPVPA